MYSSPYMCYIPQLIAQDHWKVWIYMGTKIDFGEKFPKKFIKENSQSQFLTIYQI